MQLSKKLAALSLGLSLTTIGSALAANLPPPPNNIAYDLQYCGGGGDDLPGQIVAMANARYGDGIFTDADITFTDEQELPLGDPRDADHGIFSYVGKAVRDDAQAGVHEEYDISGKLQVAVTRGGCLVEAISFSDF